MSTWVRTILAACSVGAAACAQAEEAPPYAVPRSSVIALPTADNGVDYQLYVRASPACARERLCPAVYMLDAEYSFAIASLVAEHLEDRGQLEPLVLVAIAYRDKSQYRLNRTRDYTPTFAETGGYGSEYQRTSGGGPDFLNVIENEIVPYVEARFPVSAERRGVVGHSYGGLFATFAVLSRPELFDRALIVSPSYWYDDEMIFALEQEAGARADGGETWAFLGVGEYEEQPASGRAMVSLADAMSERLTGRRNFSVISRVFENETHASIFPTALSTGLRALFPPID